MNDRPILNKKEEEEVQKENEKEEEAENKSKKSFPVGIVIILFYPLISLCYLVIVLYQI